MWIGLIDQTAGGRGAPGLPLGWSALLEIRTMERYPVELTRGEYERLNSKYPESKVSSVIGKRAEKIVKIYFRKQYPQCQFAKPPKGARPPSGVVR